MANIHKGKQRLKDKTIEDIAMKNSTDRKQNVFMQNNEKGLILDPGTQAAVETQRIKETTERQRKERQEYNNSLLTLDEMYTEDLKPINGYIVRLSVIPLMETESGLLLGNQRKVMTKTANGHDKGLIVDPWQFSDTAVIVCGPDHDDFLTSGKLVQIVTPKCLTMGDQVVDYENSYIHPSVNATEPTKVISDPHFGYALIPRGWIRIILGDSYHEKYLKG